MQRVEHSFKAMGGPARLRLEVNDPAVAEVLAGHTWDERFDEMAAQVECALRARSSERLP